MGKRGNGEGTITRNDARGRWEGRVTVGYDTKGRAIRRKATGATRKEVVKRLHELRIATESGQELARADLTVRRFLEQWQEDILPGTVAPNTERQYRDVVRLYLVPHIGLKRLRTLTARDVSLMLAALEEAGLSPNTRRLARSILRRALRWAEVEGMVARNVAALADGVKVGQPDSTGKALTPDAARRFLAALAGDRLEAAFTVALSIGLRRGEVLGLSWDDVDLDAVPVRLRVHRALVRIPGQGLELSDIKTESKGRRTVQLPSQVVDALRRHRVTQLEERLLVGPDWPELPLGADLVFRTPFGTPLDPRNFSSACCRLTEAAGVGRRSPHQLRHSAASLLIAQGVPLKMVSETLGHSSIRITADVYGHLYDEAGAVAADAMTAALWGEA